MRLKQQAGQAKAYKRLQSQGHVKKGPTVVASLMLVAYSVVEIIKY